MSKVDQSGASAGGDIVGGDKITNFHFSVDPSLADEKISEELQLLKAKRWFPEFDRIEEARRLASLCITGKYAGGSDEVRHLMLVWCARILTNEEDVAESIKIFEEAKKIWSSEDADIAEAFIVAKKDGKAAALAILGGIATPASNTVSLMIVAQHEGDSGALSWLSQSGYTIGDFDADGKCFIVGAHLQEENWDDAKVAAERCDFDDIKSNPFLLFHLAMVDLVRIVPVQYRRVVRVQRPFEMRDYELASGDVALESHTNACNKFEQAAEVFERLGLHRIAEVANGYGMWLGLRHPTLHRDVRKRLREGLSDISRSVELVPFALQFGEHLDIGAVEEEILRQVARHGGPTLGTAVARLSIALTQTSGADAAAYIARYREELVQHIERRFLGVYEIEMLSSSGQLEQAKRLYETLLAEIDFSKEEKERIEFILSKPSEEDQVSRQRALYEKNKSLADLRILVEALFRQGEWSQLEEHSMDLFSQTNSISAAEKVVISLFNQGKSFDVLVFFDGNPGLTERSVELKSLQCWALYRTGNILKAREILKAVLPEDNFPQYRNLRRNIAIAIGDWNDLSQIVADEAKEIDSRSARELLQAAYLGYQIGSPEPTSRDLLFASAEKGADDAHVLAAAYFLAVNVGLDDDPKVADWLKCAADLSGADGPIYQASLKEILEKQPDWNRRQEEILGLVRRGEIPMFIVAPALNSSLVELILLSFLHNQEQVDPRRRVAIPALSGKHEKKDFGTPKIIGLDVSSLLVLGMLGLLDDLGQVGCKFIVAHSTMEWLFIERNKAAFHQPSRVKRAQKIQELLANGSIHVFEPLSQPPDDLREQIGDVLSSMLLQAKEAGIEKAMNMKVVRSAPVHRISTLLEEEADLQEYHDCLISCQGLVKKIVAMGRMTNARSKEVLAFLALNERKWPDEDTIEDNSVLLLDDLSVTYLQQFDLIKDLNAAGFTVFVSSGCVEEKRSLVDRQHLSSMVDSVVENIRRFVHVGIVEGSVLLGPAMADEFLSGDESFQRGVILEFFSLVNDCDLVVADDRFFNQYEKATGPDGSTCPMLTSVDIINSFRQGGLLDGGAYKDIIAKLRRGGFLFLDVDAEELFEEIVRCSVVDGELIETAELREIREYIMLTRYTSHLQADGETAWLDKILKGVISVFKRVWCSGYAIEAVTARVEWLLNLADIRGWLHCFPREQASYILHEGRALLVLLLCTPPPDLSGELRKEYLRWVDDFVVSVVEREDPSLFDKIVEHQRKIMLSGLESDFLDEVDGLG